MSQPKRDYDSTVARIAGNIAAGLVTTHTFGPEGGQYHRLAPTAVNIARWIVAEVKATEPRVGEEQA